jgi:hypothetical protein
MAKSRSTSPTLEQIPAAASIFAGVARRDITSPVGIYARMWGAAKHDRSEGTHKPLLVTALVMRQTKTGKPIALLSVDLALIGDMGGPELKAIREAMKKELKIDESSLVLACSHTHASAWPAMSRATLPGGEMIPDYIKLVERQCVDATREAMTNMQAATATFTRGKCNLAVNRDLPDPDKSKKRMICGYNPDKPADDTLIVGRITANSDDSILATIVNYGCHPTTLAWENRRISPDYIGAMRETVEQNTGHAPCLFLQGASGELSPAWQYVGDTAVPDKHGRQLGFAALSALTSMLPPAHKLVYEGVMESGAPLAVWLPKKFKPQAVLKVERFDVTVPRKNWPTEAEIDATIASEKDRTMRERLHRKRMIIKSIGDGKTCTIPVWAWRIGSTLLVAQPDETYSSFQIDLRAAMPDNEVLVVNVANAGEIGYLPPKDAYKLDLYQVWQTPYDKGCLEVMTSACVKTLKKLAK